MKRCPSCGHVASDDSLDFCTGCGAYFSETHDPAPLEDILPEDPLERGCLLLDAGRLGEGVTTLTSWIGGGAVPDDRSYARVVDGITACMLSIVVQPDAYRSADMPALEAALPDRDPIRDVMEGLASNLCICSIRNGVLGLANAYMMLLEDHIATHPDIRDVSAACSAASESLGCMVEKADGLPNGFRVRGPDPIEWLRSYHGLCVTLADAAASVCSSNGSAELDSLARSWSEVRSPKYMTYVRGAFKLAGQIPLTGRFSRKMAVRAMESEAQVFARTYADGPRR